MRVANSDQTLDSCSEQWLSAVPQVRDLALRWVPNSDWHLIRYLDQQMDLRLVQGLVQRKVGHSVQMRAARKEQVRLVFPPV